MTWSIDPARYAELYGPTVGDRIRLADTELWVEVEADDTEPGDDEKRGAKVDVQRGLTRGLKARAFEPLDRKKPDDIRAAGGEPVVCDLEHAAEAEVAESLAQAMGKPNVLDFIPLGQDYSIIELEPSDPIVGKSLEELDLRNRFGVTVVGVKEYLTGERQMNPPGSYVVADDVSLLIMGRSDQIERLQREAGR